MNRRNAFSPRRVGAAALASRVGAAALASAGLAAALASAGLAAASGGPAVTWRIEGLHKTLLIPTAATGEKHSVTVGGTPAGKCPGNSAAGSLDVATHHHWTGKYYPSLNDIFVSTIYGEKPSGNDYWVLFVNDRPASHGICTTKLLPGQQLVFDDGDGKMYPSALAAPRSAVVANPFRVKLVGYDAHGKSKPLGHITITGAGIKAAKTDANGTARITATHAGAIVLRAAPKGYIRTESVVRVAT